ncbi:hypothetical protein ACFO3U_05235 [Flavobacterium ponti]|uniref:Uncharacterized protein n=1 Tax=Flavobacterium ponti TaxID=665133 RepID=A0ABV9P390_9FLAO
MMKITATIFFILIALITSAQTEKITTNYGIMRDCFGGFGQCDYPNDTLNRSQLGRKLLLVDKDVFKLEIDRNQITKEEELFLAGKRLSLLKKDENPLFIQQEDILIDDELLIQLGIDSKFKLLKKGSYPTLITDEKVIITFTLVENN